MDTHTRSARADVDGLFEKARNGDQLAWQVLFETSYPKVVRAIRRRLNSSSAMRSRFDSADFVNDVWKSLAAKSDRFDFPSLGALLRFLEDAVQQKFVDEWRRMHTQKRDLGRERSLGALGGDSVAFEPRSNDPTPSQCMQEEETRQRLMASSRTEEERRIIELRKQGYSNGEIAAQTGWNVRSVQRFLQNLKKLHDSREASGSGGN